MDSWNRERCGVMVGTCGECKSGYVGVSGPSNTVCVKLETTLTTRHRHLTSSQQQPNTTSTAMRSCDSDAACAAYGLFLECNLQSYLCQPIQQSCPNSCSGHGQCVFVSKYDPGVSVLSCGLMDLDCVSRCDCAEGYAGSSCSLAAEDLLKKMDVRQLLVESVGSLMSVENPWKTNVKSWMNSLSLLASDYLSLSDESKKLMTSLVIEILKVSREVELSIEDLSEVGMDKVVDLCVSGLFSSISLSDGDTTEDLAAMMSLLREYSGFVTSDMLENQYPVSSITPFLRFSSFYLSSTPTTSSLPLSIPETSFENYLKSLGQSSSSQQSIEFSSGILYPLQLSISEILFEATTIEKVNATENVTVFENQTQLTPPLVVTLQSSPCSSNGKEDTNPHCLMKVVLQNKIKNSNSPDQAINFSSSSSTSSYFDVACVKGVAEELSYVCPSGQVLTAYCNGSVAMKGRRYCSERSSEVECRTTVQSSSATSHSQDICQLSEYNESVTICLCDLSQVGVVGDESSVSFSILSIQKSVTRDFVSTWETLPDLSSGDVAGSWVVLVTVGAVGVTFLVMMLIGIQSDRKERHSVSTDFGSRRNMHSLFSSGITPIDPSQRESEVHEDVKMIEDALPSIFKSNSLWNKFLEEMKIYHRWLGIVFYYSPEFPRAMRVLSLFSSIVIMLFVQSVTYNIADPDDGSCESCEDESCCLSLRSTLNSNEDQVLLGKVINIDWIKDLAIFDKSVMT